ncbi:hypothetical protein A3218_17920 [Pseudomonas chlororaphis]|nr:hypothetical protein A3218_17920 [Pseudomonas chlororaphis]
MVMDDRPLCTLPITDTDRWSEVFRMVCFRDMPQGTAQNTIILKSIQRLIGARTNDHTIPPMLGQRGQTTIMNARKPSPIALGRLKQFFQVSAIGLVDDEYERPHVSQVGSLSPAVHTAILLGVVVSQQGLPGSTFICGVQNQAQGVAESELFSQPLFY